MLAASTRLGPYEILAPLGAGGMGEVYRARDTRLGRDVAIKVLPAAFASDPDRLARFEREARAVAAISHPNILAIHDYGTQETITFAVMELLEGETLRSRLAAGPLAWRDATEIGAAISDGLAAAHAKGIVHRDLKPENVFLTHDGRVKILDFGLARIGPAPSMHSETMPHLPAATEIGTIMGTAGYMSPEQVRGRPVDAPSDLFSLGCVLYEMVTGRRAFERETAVETMAAVLHDEPPAIRDVLLHVPNDIERVIQQCLMKNPNQRLHSARDLALALRAVSNRTELELPAALRPTDASTPATSTAAGSANSTAVDPMTAMSTTGSRKSSGPVSAQRGMGARIVATAMLLVIFVVTLVVLMRASRNIDNRAIDTNTPPIDAVAVLPFVHSGGDQATEMLSQTLAGHIIESLRQVRRPNLSIRPLSSVSRYARERPDNPTIGQSLNVPLLVTGTLLQRGDELTITVEVVDATDDNLLWSRPYRVESTPTLDLVLLNQIASDVAANLGLQLSAEEQRQLTRHEPDDAEAYRLYLEAMHHFHKFTPEGLSACEASAKMAIERDPQFARAYVAVARSHILRGSLFVGPNQAYPLARPYIEKALSIDPQLPDAHSAMGIMYLFQEWNWNEAERSLRRALETDANTILTRHILGFCQAAQNRLDEALVSIRRAQELDPLAAARRHEVALCYNLMRRYDDAIREAEAANQFDPHFFLSLGEAGVALSHTNQHEEAVRVLQKAVEVGRGHPRMQGLLGYAHVRAGQAVEAENTLQALLADRRFGTPFAIARIYAARGQTTEAFEWLQAALDERDPAVIWLKSDPTLDNLRDDQRFTQLLEQMGL